jgi:hypothetical protein
MSLPRKLLIIGSLALAVWGMGYGLYYAVFAEHQALDRMGTALAAGFSDAATQQISEAKASLDLAAQGNYVYVRQVDAHGHWISLALLLLILGIGFDRVAFGESMQLYLALSLLLGGILFPLGVLLETWSRGAGPQALAVTGSALLIIGLAGTAWGFARAQAS